MDLAEQVARRVFDLAASGAPKDPAGLLRHGPMAWSVVLFSPYQLIFGVTGGSTATCSIKSKGGRTGSNHFETFGTFAVDSVDAAETVFLAELAAWPERRDGIGWDRPGRRPGLRPRGGQ